MDGITHIWLFMAVPLAVLGGNLFFPRSQVVKVVALVCLFAAVPVNATLSYIPVGTEIVRHQQGGSVAWDVICVGAFKITLCIALPFVFGMLRVDVISRAFERRRTRNA